MPYRVHHTDAVILSSRIVGESDREYRLLTRDYGLVRARARAVRLGKSKLRYVLQPFRAVRADLIHGKVGWRITSAVLSAEFPGVRKEKEKRVIAASGFRLVARLVHGEESVPAIFDDLIDFLSAVDTASLEDSHTFELLFAARVLGNLGYWKPMESDEGVFDGGLKDAPLAGIVADRSRFVASINEALRQTHL
jgi:DNA repair protein RecO